MRSDRASCDSRPPMPAARAPMPGAGIDVCTPSAKEPAYATTACTGRPIRAATSPRASSSVPPPCDSTNPPRRRSLARLTRRGSMPWASIAPESAVADMSAKPMMPSVLRSSKPPATTNSALPTLILSTPSSTDTAVVAHAATGWIIAP